MKLPRILAPVVAGLFAAGAAHAQVISLITTPAGSFSNSAGAAMAKVVSEGTKLRMTIQAQAATGFEDLEAGTVEFNVGNSFDTTFFALGQEEYKARGPAKSIRHVAAMIPYRVAMHVRANSDIKTIADLKGKRVSSGFNAQKTIARIIAAHLANAGLSYKDVVGVPAPNVVRQAEDFKTGKTDVLFFAIGSGAIKEASVAVGGLRVLEVNASPASVESINKLLPGAYILNVKPRPNIEGIDKPTNIIAFDMHLNSSAKVREEVVYQVVKALYNNKKKLMSSFRPFALFNPQTMGKAVVGTPFHPGAIKFYREMNLWPPK